MKLFDLSGNTQFRNIVEKSVIIMPLSLLQGPFFIKDRSILFRGYNMCENGPIVQLKDTNATNEKKSIVMSLFKDIESQKKVRMKWPNNIPTRNSLFGPVVGAKKNAEV